MKVLSLFVVLVLALQSECRHALTGNAGDPCTPSAPISCGRSQLLGETSVPSISRFGPNVCNFTRAYQIGTRTHSLQQRCSWSWYRQECRLYCLPNSNCTGPMMNFTRSRIACCEGFTSVASSFHSIFHYHHRSIFKNEGCTIALMATVIDCLGDVNATAFRSFVSSVPELLETLTSEDSRVTVFAPTNEAIEGLDGRMQAELFGGGAAEVTLSAHVANSTPNIKLFHGRVLSTLAERRLLHVTEVEDIRRRGHIRYKIGQRTFINGAEVVVKDACQARNGIVHVMDSIIPSSNLSIAEQLCEDSQFSIFKDLVDASGISVNLNQSSPCTLFVPTNEAFQQLPSGAVECLKMENNSRALSSLLLLHISYPAEYTSSLCLRTALLTFLWPVSLTVRCINDTVHITRDEIPLGEGADHPARNGVFHAIDEVIVPDSISFESICPITTSSTSPTTLIPQNFTFHNFTSHNITTLNLTTVTSLDFTSNNLISNDSNSHDSLITPHKPNPASNNSTSHNLTIHNLFLLFVLFCCVFLC